MQDDINLYATGDRLNNTCFRQKLDSISKNIFRRENPLELVFQDISAFDAQNPVVGSLLKGLGICKIFVTSDFVRKATPPRGDIDIEKRLDPLKNDNLNFNRNNKNDLPTPSQSSFNTFIPPTSQPPGTLLLPPPPPNNFNPVQLPPSPPSLNPPPPPHQSFNLSSPQQIFGKATMTKTKTKPKQEQLIEDIDSAIYEIPDPPKIEIGDPLMNVLSTDTE